jgi:hypothetical protein
MLTVMVQAMRTFSKFSWLLVGVLLFFQQPAIPVTLPSTTTTTTTTVKWVTDEDIVKWRRVAWCETHGNWHMHGATFSGGLGISNIVWREYGGLQYGRHAGEANMHQQIIIAKKINHNGYVPDQNGTCSAW